MNVRTTELHGLSAFALTGGIVHHTYSCYDRGTDVLNGTWQLLDRAPNGRGHDLTGWPRHHDEYEAAVAEEDADVTQVEGRRRWLALIVLCLGEPDDRARHDHRERRAAVDPGRTSASPRRRSRGS